jgi:hypothetical protein
MFRSHCKSHRLQVASLAVHSKSQFSLHRNGSRREDCHGFPAVLKTNVNDCEFPTTNSPLPPSSPSLPLACNSTICWLCERSHLQKNPYSNRISLKSWRGCESLFECHRLTDSIALWMWYLRRLPSSWFLFHLRASLSIRRARHAIRRFDHTPQATETRRGLTLKSFSSSLTRSLVNLKKNRSMKV